MAIILHLLVVLLPACRANFPIEDLFWEVGEMDTFYFSDLHQAAPTDNFKVQDKLAFGNWSATLGFNMGKRYRRPIPETEEKTLQHIVESLNQSYYRFSAVNKVNGRVCNISINGPQMVRNFIREYRRKVGTVEFNKDVLTIQFKLYGSTIGLFHFQMFNTAREGVFKFLPYRIQDLTDLYKFTTVPDSILIFLDRFEMDATEGCLQDVVLDKIKERHLQENNTMEENTTGTHVPDHVSSCGQPSWHYNICLLVESDMERTVSHFFMYAMSFQDLWVRMFRTGYYKVNRQVCTLTVNKEESDLRKSYKQYTIYECCSHAKTHPYPYEETSTSRWYCHRPYQVTEILAIISLFLSYFTMAVFPLAIKWMPSTKSTDHPNVRYVLSSFFHLSSIILIIAESLQ